MEVYSLEEGKELVSTARRAIEAYFDNPHFDRQSLRPVDFSERHGIFVTLETHPERSLRGCIGYLYGAMPVSRSIVEAAISAAFEDPRFEPLARSELDDTTIEVSALTKPEQLSGTEKEIISNLILGRHGLIIESGYERGLLLPNVATEEGFDRLEFLEAVCGKAGLSNGAWKEKGTILYTFETQIFREVKPAGEVVEVKQGASINDK